MAFQSLILTVRSRSQADGVKTLAVFRGVGQIVLQPSAICGSLILLGIALNSVAMALAALLGSLIGTVLAFAATFPDEEITRGLYGFNGALAAIAAVLFYGPAPMGILVAAACAALSTAVMRGMHKYALSPYTFPFILTVWLALLIIPDSPGNMPARLTSQPDVISAIFRSFGQVVLQPNALTGVLVLSSILIVSKRCALLAVTGSVIATLTAVVLDWPPEWVNDGLYGYNAVLVAVAAALVTRQIIIPILGIALSVLITHVMMSVGLVALTFPFVASAWVIMAAQRFRRCNEA